ncbi:ribosome biogenesis GTP-binding protein YihA/YsxC [Bacillus fonticola]|uniref:ribosome biogenesis GTP-binding protein YihA/YsxC n=1 Tax=Bacillus fonticola TaxID=2728853 RepID=UPI0014764966|nr:ribosome biogenesis GTP-binding protein YihA/YsxC [Bacillus fonticola]
MNIQTAELVISAVRPSQYPDEGFPEIALAGRSNVGKSSFINCLIRRKALARTSSKPGKTQTLNFYKLNESFYFVDVPGYGYAKVSKSEREKWGIMMETYLTTREKLQAVVLLIDSRHEPSEDDVLMYDFLKHYDLPCVIVCTKADKLSKGKQQKQLQVAIQTLQVDPEDPIVLFSAETKQGKEESWHLLERYLK